MVVLQKIKEVKGRVAKEGSATFLFLEQGYFILNGKITMLS